MDNKKKVSLVLSSGGARGLAHIGVIERLEEEGYEIGAIAGTSIGAVIGAFYACGQLNTYKKWVTDLDRLDVFGLFDFTLSTRGVIKGDKLFGTLQEIIEDRMIESLRIPFAAVATDIHHQKEVVFSEGSMYDAIRASTAIPTVFQPYAWNKTELIDGGVVNPLALNRVARSEGDLLVAVNVQANIPYKKVAWENEKSIKEEQGYAKMLGRFMERWNREKAEKPNTPKRPGFIEIINRSLDLVQDQLCRATLENHPPDMLIEISKEACGTFEFYRAKEVIAMGRNAFDEALLKRS